MNVSRAAAAYLSRECQPTDPKERIKKPRSSDIVSLALKLDLTNLAFLATNQYTAYLHANSFPHVIMKCDWMATRMRFLQRSVTAILAASAALSATIPLFAQNDAIIPKAAPIEISVDEIGKNLILIGRLKKPLGTLMTIRGKWSYPDTNVKDYSLRFTVTQVDGEMLKEPLEFNVRQLTVVTKVGSPAIPPYERHKELVGVEWTLRAYETGFLNIGCLEAYWNNPALRGRPYYFRTFTSEINGVLQP
jgi:hypothetical protein